MRQARFLLPFLNLGHVFVHLFMLIYPTALLALEPALGLSYDKLLNLSLGGFIAYGVGSLPAGWLGDHWNRRHMVALFFLGTGVAAVLTGAARSPFEIAGGLTLLGLFASIYHPVGIALLVEGASKVGRRLGFNGLCGNLGIASAALITGALAQLLGWRAAFILPGAISVLLGLAFLLLVPDLPRSQSAAAPRSAGVSRRLFARIFLLLVLATICDSIVFNAVTIAMPKLFAERLSALTESTVAIGALVSSAYVVAAFAQLWVGRLIDRHSLRRVFLPVAALQVPLLLLTGLAGGVLVLPAAAALMFFIFGLLPVLDAMIARYADERWRARAYAVAYVVSFGASPAAVPLVAALHGTAGGFTSLFYVLTIVGLGTFGAAVAFPDLDRRTVSGARPAGAVPARNPG